MAHILTGNDIKLVRFLIHSESSDKYVAKYVDVSLMLEQTDSRLKNYLCNGGIQSCFWGIQRYYTSLLAPCFRNYRSPSQLKLPFISNASTKDWTGP